MSIWGNRAVLEVTDLHAGYGRIPILNGISLSLKAGEVVGVLGHNGMGKTTLLRTLSGQIRNNSGSIIFNGKEISRQSAYRRARSGLGYVPQGRDIFPQLSVLENLKIAEFGRKGGSAIPEVLGYFSILEKLLERPGQALSGGEQQILALARCLVGRPKLILLDEPTEGIQPSIIDQISGKLSELATALNLTILLVEQNLPFIAALAQRILIIQRGEIVAKIHPDDLSNKEIVDEYLGI